MGKVKEEEERLGGCALEHYSEIRSSEFRNSENQRNEKVYEQRQSV